MNICGKNRQLLVAAKRCVQGIGKRLSVLNFIIFLDFVIRPSNMTNQDLPRLIKAFKEKTIRQLESANSWSLVFIDAETSSILSIDKSDYEHILKKKVNTKGYDIIQKPYLISGYKFYAIEINLPF